MSGAGATARIVTRSTALIIIAGCAVAALNFGPRSTMGFFLTPIAERRVERPGSVQAFAG